MKCNQAEEWLSRSLDGELPADQRQALDEHLAACPSCRALQAEWSGFATLMRDQEIPAMQTPEAAWADVQRAIRLQGEARRDEGAGVFGWRLRWAGVSIAAVLLGISALGLWRANRVGPDMTQAVEVEFVETDIPGASPMVYQDAETGWTVIWVAGMETGADTGKGS
jgi:predicted anti-sigma-YlaC factor YlaD